MTPARAGTTVCTTPPVRPAEDDPRSRGDDPATQRATKASIWMTPARAGTTFGREAERDHIPDDPRSRGDDTSMHRGTIRIPG